MMVQYCAVVWAFWVVLLGFPAFAEKRTAEQRLDALLPALDALIGESDAFLWQVQPGRGFMTEGMAIERFEQSLFLYMIGNYEPAAEGFFTLVATQALANQGLQGDAEWYLAGSLHRLGHLQTAEALYKTMMARANHPFYDNAVRGLLDIYVQRDQPQAFTGLYTAEIASGRVAPSDALAYVLGRAFFQQGQLDKAVASLQVVSPESPYAPKASYVLGAIQVAQNQLDAAAATFGQLALLTTTTAQDRQLVELAQLALARIGLEQGDYQQASARYAQVDNSSVWFSDKLYEQLWTFIKQKNQLRAERLANKEALTPVQRLALEKQEQNLVRQALQGVRVFLVAFPDHAYTVPLRLLEGHLRIQAGDYDEAITTYEQFIDYAVPLQTRFGELAQGELTPHQVFQQLTDQRGQAGSLPDYALAMIEEDPDLKRSMAMYRALTNQGERLERCDALVAELSDAFLEVEGIGGFERLRYQLSLHLGLLVQKQFELLEIEEQALASVLSGRSKRQVVDLKDRRIALLNQTLSGVKPFEWAPEWTALRERYGASRELARGPGIDGLVARLDQQHQRLATAVAKLTEALPQLDSLEQSELVSLKETFETEKPLVSAHHAAHGILAADAEVVSAELTHAGFERIEAFFAQSVVRAEVGIIDVLWAQKREASGAILRAVDAHNSLRDDLNRRFERIEHKMRM